MLLFHSTDHDHISVTDIMEKDEINVDPGAIQPHGTFRYLPPMFYVYC